VGSGRGRSLPTSRWAALFVAAGIGLLAAACWAVLRGILELGATSLVVSGLGGWAIGRTLRQANLPALLAAAMGVAAWLSGLIIAWLLAMALLPASSRTFVERLESTPFLDWLSPQLGLLEITGLFLYAVAAGYAARASAGPGSSRDPAGRRSG